MLKDSQQLCQDTESKLDDKIALNQELLKQVDDHQKRIEDLEVILRRFLVTCEVYDPEAAIAEVQRMKREHHEREQYATVDIESRLAGLLASRKENFDSLCQQIEDQGRSLQSDLHALGELVNIDQDDSLPREIANTLQSTNRLLEERMDQLRVARIYDSDDSDDEVPRRPSRSNQRRDDGDEEGLGPTIWMAKTRDVLALERQIHNVNRKLDHAVNNCHFLARENQRLHASLGGQSESLPETLL